MLKEVIRPAGGVLELPNGGATSPVHTRRTSLHSCIEYHQASVQRMLRGPRLYFYQIAHGVSLVIKFGTVQLRVDSRKTYLY